MLFTINAQNEVNLLTEPVLEQAERTAACAYSDKRYALHGIDGALVFDSSRALTKAGLEWPMERLVSIWNRMAPRAGFKEVKKFENRQIAVVRIWRAIEKLAADEAAAVAALVNDGPDFDATGALAGGQETGDGELVLTMGTGKTGAVVATAALQERADVAACAAPNAAPKGGKAQRTTKPAKAARKPAAAKTEAQAEPREGTAKDRVIAMLKRKNGATLQEIMEETGWQPHTVRGFISTLGKKAGLEITSSRRESDKARVYEVAR